MIEYDYDDRDEVIRPRHVVKKQKPKKATHKHEYETKLLMPGISQSIIVQVCKVCGREGKSKIVRSEN